MRILLSDAPTAMCSEWQSLFYRKARNCEESKVAGICQYSRPTSTYPVLGLRAVVDTNAPTGFTGSGFCRGTAVVGALTINKITVVRLRLMAELRPARFAPCRRAAIDVNRAVAIHDLFRAVDIRFVNRHA